MSRISSVLLLILSISIVILPACGGSSSSTPSGSLDIGFNNGGTVVHHSAAGGVTSWDSGRSITMDSVGKILVTGKSQNSPFDNDMVIWRYNGDGTLDTSFNSGGIIPGIVIHDGAAGSNRYDFGTSITTDSSGKILVTGSSSNGTNDDMVIWRYNEDGTLDTGFNTNGYVVHDSAAGGNSHDVGSSIAMDASGKILVTGSSRDSSNIFDMVIWRYSGDGTLDTSFNTNGYVVHNNAAGGNFSDNGYSITTDSSGKILVTGQSQNSTFNNDMVIWKYNGDGTLDTSFNSGGTIPGIVVHDSAAGGSGQDNGTSITTGSSGKILVTGYSSNGTDSDMVIWRYNGDGTLDTSFNSSGTIPGIVVHDGAAGGNSQDNGWSITTDSSGKILVTGWSSNGTNDDMVIWKYNGDGTLDTGFNTNGYVVHNNAAGGNGQDSGSSITTDSSGRVLVTGRSYNGANDDMVIWRYNP